MILGYPFGSRSLLAAAVPIAATMGCIARTLARTAHRTFALAPFQPVSKPNVGCKSYTTIIVLLVFLTVRTCTLERSAGASKARNPNTTRVRQVNCDEVMGAEHDRRSTVDIQDNIRDEKALLADRASNSDALRQTMGSRGTFANLRAVPQRRQPPDLSALLFRHRSAVERIFNKIKHFRTIATRYEKCDGNDVALVTLAAARIWMRFGRDGPLGCPNSSKRHLYKKRCQIMINCADTLPHRPSSGVRSSRQAAVKHNHGYTPCHAPNQTSLPWRHFGSAKRSML